MWGGREGTIDTSSGGYTASNNVTANPDFANEAAHHYAISPSSPCLALAAMCRRRWTAPRNCNRR